MRGEPSRMIEPEKEKERPANNEAEAEDGGIHWEDRTEDHTLHPEVSVKGRLFVQPVKPLTFAGDVIWLHVVHVVVPRGKASSNKKRSIPPR